MAGKNNYHYAETLGDRERTGCDQPVGYLITHGEDVTADKEKLLDDPDRCDGCESVCVLGDA